MTDIHRLLGYSVPAAFLVLALWTLVSVIRKSPPGEWYWRLVAVVQIALGVQVIAGAVLFALGHRPIAPSGPAWLHYFYGGVFPIALLIAAHRYGAAKLREAPYLAFGVVALVNFGLTFRALQTGLG